MLLQMDVRFVVMHVTLIYVKMPIGGGLMEKTDMLFFGGLGNRWLSI